MTFFYNRPTRFCLVGECKKIAQTMRRRPLNKCGSVKFSSASSSSCKSTSTSSSSSSSSKKDKENDVNIEDEEDKSDNKDIKTEDGNGDKVNVSNDEKERESSPNDSKESIDSLDEQKANGAKMIINNNKLDTILKKLAERMATKLALNGNSNNGNNNHSNNTNGHHHHHHHPSTIAATSYSFASHIANSINSQPHQHVSPRKRILRELEKVSLEDTKRSRPKTTMNGNGILSSPSPIVNLSSNNNNNNNNNSSNVSSANNGSLKSEKPARPFSSYSITSLLAHNTSNASNGACNNNNNNNNNSINNQNDSLSTSQLHPHQQQRLSPAKSPTPSSMSTKRKSPTTTTTSTTVNNNSNFNNNSNNNNSPTTHSPPSPEHHAHAFHKYRPMNTTPTSSSSPYNSSYHSPNYMRGSPSPHDRLRTTGSYNHHQHSPSHYVGTSPHNSSNNNYGNMARDSSLSPNVDRSSNSSSTGNNNSNNNNNNRSTPTNVSGIRNVPKKTAALRQQFSSPTMESSSKMSKASCASPNNKNEKPSSMDVESLLRPSAIIPPSIPMGHHHPATAAQLSHYPYMYPPLSYLPPSSYYPFYNPAMIAAAAAYRFPPMPGYHPQNSPAAVTMSPVISASPAIYSDKNNGHLNHHFNNQRNPSSIPSPPVTNSYVPTSPWNSIPSLVNHHSSASSGSSDGNNTAPTLISKDHESNSGE
jgi:hypothetical protein